MNLQDKFNQINQDFYDSISQYFSDSRGYFWDGWKELLPYINSLDKSPIKFLDIGCGNCRFYDFLQENNFNFDYLGIDSSKELLIHKSSSSIKTKCINITDLNLETNSFDMAVLFGVAHHLNQESNKNLLQKIFQNIQPKGYLIVSLWQFKNSKVLQKKILEKTAPAYLETLKKYKIEPEQVGENDFFLDWKRGLYGVRYCHQYTFEEYNKIVCDLGFKIETSYLADGPDGKSNCYGVWKKS